MNTIKHWFMKHFYQDIYNLYRKLEEQQEINRILNDRLTELEKKLGEK
jgi:hypothetical protein